VLAMLELGLLGTHVRDTEVRGRLYLREARRGRLDGPGFMTLERKNDNPINSKNHAKRSTTQQTCKTNFRVVSRSQLCIYSSENHTIDA
jgi:hypothetical protein